MKCQSCERSHSRNLWSCPQCGSRMEGGVVFVTGISGSGIGEKLQEVVGVTQAAGHNHRARVHDVGEIMRQHALRNDPDVNWDRILDASPRVLRFLRALAFQEISYAVRSEPDVLHLVDLHLCFRWKAFLTKGFEPYILQGFIPHVRCFINIVEDLAQILERLAATAWGTREILELLIWRDEELLLTDMFSDVCGLTNSFAIARAEPASEFEKLVWHPEMKRVYLSFPITAILQDRAAQQEITQFRDEIRKFLTVFDPYACKDYDETYRREEMKVLKRQVGETTVDRDFRFIDQADAVVVYYPRKVSSQGVDAEMRHAVETGKPIFLYCPEELGGSPFAPPASHTSNDKGRYIALLREKLEGLT